MIFRSVRSSSKSRLFGLQTTRQALLDGLKKLDPANAWGPAFCSTAYDKSKMDDADHLALWQPDVRLSVLYWAATGGLSFFAKDRDPAKPTAYGATLKAYGAKLVTISRPPLSALRGHAGHTADLASQPEARLRDQVYATRHNENR